MYDCMPTGISPGPGDNFLVGCADHDGEAFPSNEYIITKHNQRQHSLRAANTGMANAPANANCLEITQVGGVDETWYNPGR